MYSGYFIFTFPFKSLWFFIEILPKDESFRFCWNSPYCSGEDYLFINFAFLQLSSLVLQMKKFNPLHPKIICAKFNLNGPASSGDRDRFLYVFNVFLLYRKFLPLERGVDLYSNLFDIPKTRGWNRSSGSGETIFIRFFFNEFPLFPNFLLERGLSLI